MDQSNDLKIMRTSRTNLPKCDASVTTVNLLELVDRPRIEHKQGMGHVNLDE